MIIVVEDAVTGSGGRHGCTLMREGYKEEKM